jgi:hypothetical protein
MRRDARRKAKSEEDKGEKESRKRRMCKEKYSQRK